MNQYFNIEIDSTFQSTGFTMVTLKLNQEVPDDIEWENYKYKVRLEI